MTRKKYTCTQCDNECRLSLRQDAQDKPEHCPIDAYDTIYPEWEEDDDD